MKIFIGALLIGIAIGAVAVYGAGPSTPRGNSVLNQAIYGFPLVKSDTATFPFTRGLHVGDASSCNITVVFQNNPGIAIAINSVQPGQDLPYSVTQLRAATTCTDIVGLW